MTFHNNVIINKSIDYLHKRSVGTYQNINDFKINFNNDKAAMT